MYRPENWKEIVRANCFDGDCVYREIDTFEAGADAILGVLKEDGVFTYGNHTPDIELKDAPEESGYWVFIPEE